MHSILLAMSLGLSFCLTLLFISLLLIQWSACSPPARKFRRKALLVGINGTYPTEPGSDSSDLESDSEEINHLNGESEKPHSTYRGAKGDKLAGARNGVLMMKKHLISSCKYKEEDITMLIDSRKYAQPTQENILRAMEDLVADAQPFDRFVFVFAGHGFQRKAKPEDEEEDGLNEFISTMCGKGVKDNILNEKLVANLPPDCKLTAIFDCCHSGTMLDLEHNKCNRVFVPWVNKGRRRTLTLRYQVVRKNSVDMGSTWRSSSIFGSISNWLKARVESNEFLHKVSLRNNMHQNTSSNNPVFSTILAPESSGAFSRNPKRRPKIGISIPEQRSELPMLEDAKIMESPKSRYCHGWCRQNQESTNKVPSADVICLSSSQDSQATWEDFKGDSLIQYLVAHLQNDPRPNLYSLMTHIHHRVYDANTLLHQESRNFRKARAQSADEHGLERTRVFGSDGRRLSDLEMTTFQLSELSSPAPLDMHNKKWSM